MASYVLPVFAFFSCCATILCQPLLAQPLCTNKVDIVVAVDSSGSMETSWDHMINDVAYLISRFVIGDEFSRVAIIDYSAVTNMIKPLDANNTEDNVSRSLEVLRKMPQLGESWPELALERAADIFQSSLQRNTTKRSLVLFTDGDITSKDKSNVKALLKNMELHNIEVYVKETGNKLVNEKEDGLQLLASRPENLYGNSQRAKYGQPLLEDALCWNTSNSISSHPTSPPVTPKGSLKNQYCFEKPDAGPCKSVVYRYFYNSTSDKCELFVYGGCGGNANNFGSEKECSRKCKDDDVNPTPTFSFPTELILKKCVEMRDRAITMKLFVPRCTNEGDFEAIQHEPGTGYSWCVNQQTGEELYGSRVNGGKIECEKTSKTTSPKTRCEIRRQKSLQKLKILPDIFVPTCSSDDGLYEDIQSSFWFSWCVNRYSGEMITSPLQHNGPVPVCPEKTKCEKDQIRAVAHNYKNTDRSGTAVFVPECQANGLYKKLQFTIYDGVAWCVDEITGKEINGSRNGGHGDTLPECPGPQSKRCLLPIITCGPQAATNTNKYVFNKETAMCERIASNLCGWKEGNEFETMAECEETCGVLTKCLVEQQLAIMKESKDVFVPRCDGNGLFRQIQTASNGSSWCVNIKTGVVVESTMVEHGQADCSKVKSSDVEETNKTEAPYEKPFPEPEPGPQVNESHRPRPQPEAEYSPAPENDKFNPSFTCSEEVDFANQRKGTMILVGVFIPQCDVTGNYLPLQRYGSTGEKWCVVPTSGKLIEGTKRGPGEPDPDCSRAGNMNVGVPIPTPNILTETSNLTTPSTTTIVTTTQAPPQTPKTTTAGKTTNTSDCEYVIGSNLIKLGCFRDTHQMPQPLPVQLFNKSSEGQRVKDNLEQFASFLRKIVCECSNETRAKGWYTFGIQNYGECYSGPDEGRYNEDGPANAESCLNENNTPCSKNDTLACVGVPKKDSLTGKVESSNAIFMIKTEKHQSINVIEYDRKKRNSIQLKKVKRSIAVPRKNRVLF